MNDLGIDASMGVIGAFLLVLIWAFREMLTIYFLKWKKKIFKKTDKIEKGTDIYNRPLVEDHFFFVNIQELIARKLPTIKCGCHARTEMLRDMLTDYLTSWHDIFNEFIAAEVKREGFEDRGPKYAEQFSNRVSTMLTDLQNSINDKWIRRGIPPSAISAFKKWDSELIESLIIQSEKVAQSAFFSTNRIRLIVIMVQHASFLSTIVHEARYMVGRMNGNLDGQIYNRRTIEPMYEDNPHDANENRISSLLPKPDIQKKYRSGEWREGRSESEIRLKKQDP